MDTETALIVDILLLIMSLWVILQVSERSIFNPSLWWVALHAYAVTFRLITLNLGVESIPIFGIRSDVELVNAAIACDISLLAVVGATLFAARKNPPNRIRGSIDKRVVQLNPLVGNIISILCLTIGTFALIVFSRVAIVAGARGVDIATIDIGRFDESSYPAVISGFAIQGSMIQCAMRGFTRWTLVPFLILLVLTAINPARTAFVLVVVMMFMIYQAMRNQQGLPLKWAVGGLILGCVWFVYKPFVVGVLNGDNSKEIMASVQDYVQESASRGASGDTQFLDMQATYMGAADDEGIRLHGATILPLLYLPIPRFLWPDKPSLNESGQRLTSHLRPIGTVGMTPNLSGESYIDFGWIGCAIIPFLYMVGMQTAFRQVNGLSIVSVARWTYVIILVCMLQVFRDGLVSLFTYPIIAYLPLLAWGAISKVLPAANARERRISYAPRYWQNAGRAG